MSESYIQQLFAERIGGNQFGKSTAIYKFEKIKRAKQAAREAYPDVEIIDLGVGEPDEAADPGVVAKLAEEAGKRENRWYADNGIPAFKQAATRYLDEVFGVKGIDPATQVNHTIGMKPGLALTPLALINPGDVALLTVPGYPVLGTHTKYLGGEVVNLELKAENGFLPDLDAIDAETRKRAKLLYLNYPNNPTGAAANREFFEQAVAFARENELVVIHDAAYAGLVFEREPLSFLSVPGAVDVGIEMHSLSKSFNMTGWRLGFVAGNPLLVSAFASVKDNIDSGQFIAIQMAGCYALAHPEITRRIADKYFRRHKRLVEILNARGFSAKVPEGTFFCYVPSPKGVEGGPTFASGEEFSQWLIREKQISSVPWDDVGNYVRFSATFEAADEADEKRVLDEIERRLSDVTFVF